MANTPGMTLAKADQLENHMTVAERAQTAMLKDRMEKAGLTVAKYVTRSVLRQIDGEPFIVRFECAAYQGRELEGSKMAAARLADVVNMETGELQFLVMNKVLESELDREYPDGGYKERIFAIVRSAKEFTDERDRRYKLYKIIELTEAGKAVHAVDATTEQAVDRAKKKAHR